MAFNINAHVILNGPKKLKAVTRKIERRLGSVKARIRLDIPKNLSKQIGSFNQGLKVLNKNIVNLQSSTATASRHLQTLTAQFRSLNKSSSSMSKSQSSVQSSLEKTGKQVHGVRSEIQEFGKDAALAIRRFAAFTVATGVVFGFVRAIQSATKAALDFEREIVKVVQVTGGSRDNIRALKNTINELSVSLGVDANKLAELSRTFAQTGQTIDQVRDSIRAVARSSLAPSFGEMKNTAEGLIAALAQFNIAADQSEAVLAGLNAVSKKFAVEAEDMISVIRRAGGVFASSAGQMDDPVKSLNELIGIFTAVRSTTRESADTIAVGLRTIFTRIQRRGTIDFLKQFNIELIDAKGNFIGLFPAFQALSKGLDDIIKRGDALTLSAVVEELGGVRQVGKLIPAITQFNKALAATKIAGKAAAEGLGKDVALALQPLGKQFEVLQQRFSALIRDISESKTFQNLAKVALSLGNAFLSVAEVLKPLLPMLATFAAIKLTTGLVQFGSGFVGGLKKGGGAGAVGGTLGGAITGGGGGGKGGGGSNAALISAINSSVNVQKGLRTAVQGLSTAGMQPLRLTIEGLKRTLEGNNAKITSSITNAIGAMGTLINVLNRVAASTMRIPSTTTPPRRKFATGGRVHGPSHAQGGVPAMLEGGEYVIPKGYADGGPISLNENETIGGFFLKPAKGQERSKTWKNKKINVTNPQSIRRLQKGKGFTKSSDIKASGPQIQEHISSLTQKEQLAEGLISKGQGKLHGADVKGQMRGGGARANKFAGIYKRDLTQNKVQSGSTKFGLSGTMTGFFPGANELETSGIYKAVADFTKTGLTDTITGLVEHIKSNGLIDVPPINPDESTIFKRAMSNLFKAGGAKDAVEGYVLEGMISAITAAPLAGGGTRFDFPASSFNATNKKRLGALFGSQESINNLLKADAKRTASPSNWNSIVEKLEADINKGDLNGVRPQKGRAFAAGGSVFAPQGTDTVPAMLTPGEFVVNKKSAESFGYGNLKKINQYAKGGAVEPQYLFAGGALKAQRGVDDWTDVAASKETERRTLKRNTAKSGDNAAMVKNEIKKGTQAFTDAIREIAGELKSVGGQISEVDAEIEKAKADLATAEGKTGRRKKRSVRRATERLTVAEEARAPLAAKQSELQAKKEAAITVAKDEGKRQKRIKTAQVHGEIKRIDEERRPAPRKKREWTNKWQPRATKSTEQLAKESEVAANRMKGMGDAVAGGIGAIGGFTAALSSMDFSSPEAAMSSLMALSFAVTQAQTAFAGLSAITKTAAAAEGAETATNVAAAGSEGVETVANLASAKSEMVRGFKKGLRSFDPTKRGRRRADVLDRRAMDPKARKVRKRLDRRRGIEPTTITGRTGRSFGAGAPKGASKLNSSMAGLSKGLTKIGPSLGKLAAGGVVGAGASMLIGPIGNKLDELVRGKKEEIAPGVTGVRGGTVGGAGTAGGLIQGAQGAAIGAALGTAILPGFGTVIGGVIGLAAGAAKGAFQGMAQQAEFNAIVEMTENVKDANKQLERFSKLGEVTATSLKNLNDSVAKPIASFSTVQQASFKKARSDQAFSVSGLLGKGGVAQEKMGTEGGVAASGIAGAAAGAAVGAIATAWLGPGAAIGAVIGGIIGGIGGLAFALLGTDKRIEATALSFDRAANSITPEFIENLNKAFEQASGQLMKSLSLEQVQQIAAVQTTSEDLNPAEQATMTNTAFTNMNNILGSTTGETGKLSKELQRLASIKMDAGLIDAVRAEADLLGEEGGAKFKAAFVDIRREVEKMGGFGKLIETDSMEEVNRLIEARTDLDAAGKEQLKKTILAEKEKTNAQLKASATAELVARATKRAAQALDALVAGLEQFGSKTDGIAKQMSGFADQVSNEFAQITGKKTVGQISKFNPFENISAASDLQIDTSLGQLQGLGGGGPAGEVAFKDLGSMMKAQKDFPLEMRHVLNDLMKRQAEGEPIENVDVMDAITARFGDLPPQLLAGLQDSLTAGLGRQKGDSSVFTLDTLKEMFEEGGNVFGLMGDAAKATQEQLSKAVSALNEFQNSILKVAALEQEMMQHRMSAELSILDKQQSIRDRVNKALGKTPDSIAQATGDLRDRLQTLAGGGTGGAVGVDVLNPAAMFSRLEGLQQQRKDVRGKLGLQPGQQAPTVATDNMTDEMRKNSSQLAKLNSEINGTQDALKELANDTRMLAAIETKIADLQRKQDLAKGGVTSLMQAWKKVMTGEITGIEFNEIVKPLNQLRQAFTGSISTFDAIDLVSAFDSGNALVMQDLSQQFGGNQEAMKDFIDGIRAQAGASVGGQMAGAGLGNMAQFMQTGVQTMVDTQAQIGELAGEMQKIGDAQVAILAQTMENQQAAMQDVLNKASSEFSAAAEALRDAVVEFGKMRGMPTDPPVTIDPTADPTATPPGALGGGPPWADGPSEDAERPSTTPTDEPTTSRPSHVETGEAAAAGAQAAAKIDTGDCCKIITGKLDKIIALLGTGGPKSEAAAAVEASAPAGAPRAATGRVSEPLPLTTGEATELVGSIPSGDRLLGEGELTPAGAAAAEALRDAVVEFGKMRGMPTDPPVTIDPTADPTDGPISRSSAAPKPPGPPTPPPKVEKTKLDTLKEQQKQAEEQLAKDEAQATHRRVQKKQDREAYKESQREKIVKGGDYGFAVSSDQAEATGGLLSDPKWKEMQKTESGEWKRKDEEYKRGQWQTFSESFMGQGHRDATKRTHTMEQDLKGTQREGEFETEAERRTVAGFGLSRGGEAAMADKAAEDKVIASRKAVEEANKAVTAEAAQVDPHAEAAQARAGGYGVLTPEELQAAQDKRAREAEAATAVEPAGGGIPPSGPAAGAAEALRDAVVEFGKMRGMPTDPADPLNQQVAQGASHIATAPEGIPQEDWDNANFAGRMRLLQDKDKATQDTATKPKQVAQGASLGGVQQRVDDATRVQGDRTATDQAFKRGFQSGPPMLPPEKDEAVAGDASEFGTTSVIDKARSTRSFAATAARTRSGGGGRRMGVSGGRAGGGRGMRMGRGRVELKNVMKQGRAEIKAERSAQYDSPEERKAAYAAGKQRRRERFLGTTVGGQSETDAERAEREKKQQQQQQGMATGAQRPAVQAAQVADQPRVGEDPRARTTQTRNVTAAPGTTADVKGDAGSLAGASFLSAISEAKDTWFTAGQQFGEGAKSIIQETKIEMKASLGPISINLTGLTGFREEFLKQMEAKIAEALAGETNADGSPARPPGLGG